MARPATQVTEAVNSDSFLDIVASVVSIMIIMVVMEGMRIKNTPVTASIPDHPAVAELQHELASEQSVREDVLKADHEVQQLKQWAAAREVERNTLMITAVDLEKKVEKRREELDKEKLQGFDLSRAISEAQFQLDQLTKARELADVSEAAPVVLESYSTPISRIVEKYEVHFILRGGKIAFIPKEMLEKEFVADAKSKIYKLSESSPSMTEVIGPFEGFKIRYKLELRIVGGRGEVMYLWELKPVTDMMGETAEQALSAGSAFQGELAKLRRGMHTVTIHVYGDSFDAFRKIRKDLYQRGFAVAARPLAPEMTIGFSPTGSKSTSQ
jgi:hypothetical protein